MTRCSAAMLAEKNQLNLELSELKLKEKTLVHELDTKTSDKIQDILETIVPEGKNMCMSEINTRTVNDKFNAINVKLGFCIQKLEDLKKERNRHQIEYDEILENKALLENKASLDIDRGYRVQSIEKKLYRLESDINRIEAEYTTNGKGIEELALSMLVRQRREKYAENNLQEFYILCGNELGKQYQTQVAFLVTEIRLKRANIEAIELKEFDF